MERKESWHLDEMVKVNGNKSVFLAGNRVAASNWRMTQTHRAFSWVVTGGMGGDFALFACYKL